MGFGNTYYDCNNIVLLSSFHYLLYKNQWPTHFPLIMEKIRAQIRQKEQKEILHKLFDTFEGYFWINDLSVYVFSDVLSFYISWVCEISWFTISMVILLTFSNFYTPYIESRRIKYELILSISRIFEKLCYHGKLYFLSR